MNAFICVLVHLGWNRRLSPLGWGSCCDFISCGSSRGMMSSSPTQSQQLYTATPASLTPSPSPSTMSLFLISILFLRPLVFFSNSLWIPLFSKSTFQITKKLLPPPPPDSHRHSFIRLSCLPVISFPSPHFSLSLLLSFFKGSMCQKVAGLKGQQFLSSAG